MSLKVNFVNNYFIFSRINLKSYAYSQLLYVFRKQTFGLAIKSNRNVSMLVFKFPNFGIFSSFFDYSYYFLSTNFYIKDFKNFMSWSGVYDLVFFTFSTFSKFVSFFNFSNLFVFTGGCNLVFLKFFGYIYYLLLPRFFFELKKLYFANLLKNLIFTVLTLLFGKKIIELIFKFF